MNAPLLSGSPGEVQAANLLTEAVARRDECVILVDEADADLGPVLEQVGRRLSRYGFRPILISGPQSARELMSQVLGRAGPAALTDADVEAALLALRHPGDDSRRVALLVDAAHSLSVTAMRYVQLTCQVSPRLRLVLAGRPGLVETLAGDEFAYLRQRITRRLRLPGPAGGLPALPVVEPPQEPSVPSAGGHGGRWMLAGLSATVILLAWAAKQSETLAPSDAARPVETSVEIPAAFEAPSPALTGPGDDAPDAAESAPERTKQMLDPAFADRTDLADPASVVPAPGARHYGQPVKPVMESVAAADADPLPEPMASLEGLEGGAPAAVATVTRGDDATVPPAADKDKDPGVRSIADAAAKRRRSSAEQGESDAAVATPVPVPEASASPAALPASALPDRAGPSVPPVVPPVPNGAEASSPGSERIAVSALGASAKRDRCATAAAPEASAGAESLTPPASASPCAAMTIPIKPLKASRTRQRATLRAEQVTATSPARRLSQQRCRSIVLRVQLGETLSGVDRDFLSSGCLAR